MSRAGRFLLAASVLAAARASALEGAPPFEWFATGAVAPELNAVIRVGAEAGAGQGFVGGTAERELAARSWLVAPLDLRYGFFPGLEGRLVFPFYAASSPQQYVSDDGIGDVVTTQATLSGADFGDPEVALRLRIWERDDQGAAVHVMAGMMPPLGTNVWQNSKNNFIVGPTVPDLAISDGAWKVVLAADGEADFGSWRADGFLGWVARFPVEATAMEPGLSTIEVSLPSPVVGRVSPAWKLGDAWWATLTLDGYWAPAGSLTSSGLLAQEPGSTGRLLDSYANLVEASAAAWAGVGVRAALSAVVDFTAGVAAPVVEHRAYRAWRGGLDVTYRWKP